MPLIAFYRISDRVFHHKALIEEKIFHRVQNIINSKPTLTLDASGFIRHSEVFEGNVSASLQKSNCNKKRDTTHQRTGRLKEKCKRVSARYQIDLKVDEASSRVTALTWDYQPQPASKQTHPKVYKLRTTQITRDDETLWRTYTMLTDLESVFRSLKSELGMRPVYHHLKKRCDGHLFITVLAYQAVQLIRRKLQERGIHEHWASLRDTRGQQSRITAIFKQRDGKTLHIWQATRPEEAVAHIYTKLETLSVPGGHQRLSKRQNLQNVVLKGD